MLTYICNFYCLLIRATLENANQPYYHLPTGLLDDDDNMNLTESIEIATVSSKSMFSDVFVNVNILHHQKEPKKNCLSFEQSSRLNEIEFLKYETQNDTILYMIKRNSKLKSRTLNERLNNPFGKQRQRLFDKPFTNIYGQVYVCNTYVKGFSLCENQDTKSFFAQYPINSNDKILFTKVFNDLEFKEELVNYCITQFECSKDNGVCNYRKIICSINYIFKFHIKNSKEFIYLISAIIFKTMFFQKEIIFFNELYMTRKSRKDFDYTSFFDYSAIDETKNDLETYFYLKNFKFTYEDFINYFFRNCNIEYNINTSIVSYGFVFRSVYLYYYFYYKK